MAGKVKTEKAAISALRQFVESARAGEARLVSLEQSLKQRKGELAQLRQQAERALAGAVASDSGAASKRSPSAAKRRR